MKDDKAIPIHKILYEFRQPNLNQELRQAKNLTTYIKAYTFLIEYR